MDSHEHRVAFRTSDEHESGFVADFLRRETVGGAIALVAAAIAIVWANTGWSGGYDALKHTQLGPLDIEHWAADGALTLFFFVAGLELKRELVVGSLRRPADAAVPVVAATCGVAVPALIYLLVAHAADDGHPGGWAIPAATDIAFALAVVAVVGSHLPPELRSFLLTMAVVDDLIVIVIIAAVFTDDLHWGSLGIAALAAVAYAAAQRLRVTSPLVLLPLGVATWWFVHESGVHATIAGVVLGLLTRVRPDPDESVSPAEHLEHALSPLSSGLAVPFFALVSAGVPLSGGTSLVQDPIVIGIVLGLLIGKPVGVFGGSWLVTRLSRAELSEGLGWRDVAGMSMVAGVGFTVSLLVAELSFDGAEREAAKTAVLAGSLLAGLAGAALLARRNRHHREDQRQADPDVV
jgi:NhaA family Na+:H+ antiporter